jgi:DNA-binding transcriptional ArsR family regulator
MPIDVDLKEVDVHPIAEMFRLLGDPTRLRILLACLDEPRSVGEIAARAGASQSLVSHHLRLLRGAWLVKGTRDARQVFYQAADQHVRHMLANVIAHSAEEIHDH